MKSNVKAIKPKLLRLVFLQIKFSLELRMRLTNMARFRLDKSINLLRKAVLDVLIEPNRMVGKVQLRGERDENF